MKARIITRILLGSMFLLGGALKTRRFGKAFAEETYNAMLTQFMEAYKVFPLKDTVNTPIQYQEYVGYIEMMGGFMLLSGQLIEVASISLMCIMLGAFLTLHKLEHPWPTQFSPALFFFMLASLLMPEGERHRQD